MAEARVLYGSQEGSYLYGEGGGLWRPGIPSLDRVNLSAKIVRARAHCSIKQLTCIFKCFNKPFYFYLLSRYSECQKRKNVGF